ncbi:MAG: HlyD family efflux transporter periplasmic adaptor subunit [Bauldia sp.]
MTRHSLAALPAALAAALLAACSPSAKTPAALQGYVEGTYLRIAAEDGGRIVERAVSRGQSVKAGDILFRLAEDEQRAQIAQARARVDQATSQLADLRSGKRPEEIAVAEAQLDQAKANRAATEDEYNRLSSLAKTAIVSQAVADTARQQRDVAAARLVEMEKSLAVSRLPSRPDQIAAAERNLAATQAALALAEAQLAKRTVRAPADGLITDTYFDRGESVTPGLAVVSLLPAGGRTIRFYVPEAKLAEARLGTPVTLACDRCPAGLSGTVSFLAGEAEYTPPVIYSKDNREKLVFRVEARPEGAATALPIGLPVEVSLGAPPALADARAP